MMSHTAGTDRAGGPHAGSSGMRPPIVRPEADAPLPTWPVTLMVAAYPLWFLLGLGGFTWVLFAVPMAAALARRRDLVLPKGFGWWLVFLVAVAGSVISIDSAPRLAGWMLRTGYYVAATVALLYVLNGRHGLSVWKVVRAFTWLWLATVAGGYLAFVLGALEFDTPMAYVMPAALRENELINAMVTASFAQVQDIIGVPVPRPVAPFPYTNSWGSMLALLTPFGFISLGDARAGFRPQLIRLGLFASVVPAVVSLNRGLWLSLGVGLIYAAVRFGVTDARRAVRNSLVAVVGLTLVLTITPLGGLVSTRIDTGHSNEDRLELVLDAVDGTLERPLFGWGAPRPNDRNLPSVGTHGQAWFVMFSYGFVGAAGYIGTLFSLAWYTRKQSTPAGMWAHVVIVIGIVQLPYYLHVPHQMFTMLMAAAIALRLKEHGIARLASADG